MVSVCIKDNSTLPFRATQGSAGYDLFSSENVTVPKWSRRLVKTGVSFQLEEGTYGQVFPRSGLASKKSIDIGAGVIDSDYRGDIGVLLINNSDDDFEVSIGDKIAQLVIIKISTPVLNVQNELDSTQRGENGFGSTGK